MTLNPTAIYINERPVSLQPSHLSLVLNQRREVRTNQSPSFPAPRAFFLRQRHTAAMPEKKNRMLRQHH